MKHLNRLVIILMCHPFFGLLAQDLDQIENLSMEELMAVKMDKTCLPISTDETLAAAHNSINMGMIVPRSSRPSIKASIENMIQGAQLAAREINEAGGVLGGKKLNIIVGDDAGEPVFAIQKAQELITKYDVKVILGPTQSARLMSVAQKVITEQQSLLFGINTTAIAISDLEDKGMVFRTISSDAIHAELSADFLIDQGKKRAVMFYVDNAFGKSHSSDFRRAFEGRGGSILAAEKFSPLVDLEAYDLGPKLQRILELRPEVFYVVVQNHQIHGFTRDLQRFEDMLQEFNPVFVGAEPFGDQDLPEILDGMYYTSGKRALSSQFRDKFFESYGCEPKFFSGDCYDLVYLYATALMEVGEADPARISASLLAEDSHEALGAEQWDRAKELIEQGQNVRYSGNFGPIIFEPNGDIKGASIKLLRYEGGKASVVK
ncbi:MAG: ABC transporter substrate-binding protein [Bacteroidota bacterium]